jgi:hypothetical protein
MASRNPKNKGAIIANSTAEAPERLRANPRKTRRSFLLRLVSDISAMPALPSFQGIARSTSPASPDLENRHIRNTLPFSFGQPRKGRANSLPIVHPFSRYASTGLTRAKRAIFS